MPRANLSQAAVVDAAARLADRDGAAAVTVSSVAREVGVKPASLYEHVDGLSAGISTKQARGFQLVF